MSDDTPKPGQIWRHRNGTLYEVLMLANNHSENAAYPTTVVYRTCSFSGRVWARPMHDWHRSMTLEAKP
jgi:hypothetical protein